MCPVSREDATNVGWIRNDAAVVCAAAGAGARNRSSTAMAIANTIVVTHDLIRVLID
jgi:hypothetical protein